MTSCLVALAAGVVDTGSVPLLEREAQLASLGEYAGEARRGDGRLVLIAGEAGAGKSALVEQLQHDLPEARWYWGACDGLFTPRPLGPLFDIATKLGGELLDLCRADASRESLFSALLRQISEPGQLHVLVVEDVHWADEATIDLLRFLGRRLRDTPVLLLTTYRDEGLAPTHPLRMALGDLATQRSVRRISLAPLTADAVRVLAGDCGLEPAALYRLTGGNPFYVTEVVQSGMGEVPPSARDAVLARVARLSAGAREVLEAAALIGARIELSLLELVADCPPAVLDELLGSGLLAGDGAGLKFRHEIIRLAVESGLTAHRCGLIHARILAALREVGGDDAQLAFHAEAAGDGPAVLRHASAAAYQAVELASHREAVAQFERALRFSSGAATVQLAGLYDGLARVVALLDRWLYAAAAGERALALWRETGDRRHEGDMLRHLSRAMWRLCRGPEADAMAKAAVAALEPLGPSPELGWAYANLAGDQMLGGEYDEAIGLAQRAQATATSLGLPAVLSDALNTEGCALAAQGRDGLGPLRRALDIAVAGRLSEQVGRAFTNIYTIYSAQRRFAEAEPYYTEGVAYCDDQDIATYGTCLRGEWAIVMERTGRWAESAALNTELLKRAGPSPLNRLSLITTIGLIRARVGEPGAWDYLDQAAADADGTGEPQQIVPVRLARTEAYWLEGKTAEAAREAELADDVADRGDDWDRGAVAVWLRRTRSDRGPRHRIAEPYQRELGGDPAGAAQLWTRLGCPYPAGLALLDAGDEPSLRKALQIFTDLGATAAAALTRQQMRQLGVRSIPAGPRIATRAHPLGLTRREREVLDLVHAGLTNAEIAERLYISAKTVDHHVSAVLAKLDAPTRGAAASQAARLGLVTAPD